MNQWKIIQSDIKNKIPDAGVDISWVNETNKINDNKRIAVMVLMTYLDFLEFSTDISYQSGQRNTTIYSSLE
jgi:hypothetical protein